MLNVNYKVATSANSVKRSLRENIYLEFLGIHTIIRFMKRWVTQQILLLLHFQNSGLHHILLAFCRIFRIGVDEVNYSFTRNRPAGGKKCSLQDLQISREGCGPI